MVENPHAPWSQEDHETLTRLLFGSDLNDQERQADKRLFRHDFIARHSLGEYSQFLIAVAQDYRDLTPGAMDYELNRIQDGQ